MAHGVRMWEIADKFGLSGSWFSVKMRKPLKEDETKKAMQYVDEIAAKHGNNEIFY